MGVPEKKKALLDARGGLDFHKRLRMVGEYIEKEEPQRKMAGGSPVGFAEPGIWAFLKVLRKSLSFFPFRSIAT